MRIRARPMLTGEAYRIPALSGTRSRALFKQQLHLMKNCLNLPQNEDFDA